MTLSSDQFASRGLDAMLIIYWNPKTRKWQFDSIPYTFHKHRQWKPGTVSQVTIKRDTCGRYWVCITTTYTDFRPLPTIGKSVGADFGMKDAYLTLSTGEKVQHPQPSTYCGRG